MRQLPYRGSPQTIQALLLMLYRVNTVGASATWLVLLKQSEQGPPDPSFSITFSVCLSFLYSLLPRAECGDIGKGKDKKEKGQPTR